MILFISHSQKDKTVVKRIDYILVVGLGMTTQGILLQ